MIEAVTEYILMHAWRKYTSVLYSIKFILLINRILEIYMASSLSKKLTVQHCPASSISV